MARGKRVLKNVRGPPHSSIRQLDSQLLDLEHNHPSASAGGCSSLKKHLQIHFNFEKRPGFSADLLHEAGFTVCANCKSVLVTIKRTRCTSCMNDSRHSSKSNGSSCEAVFQITIIAVRYLVVHNHLLSHLYLLIRRHLGDRRFRMGHQNSSFSIDTSISAGIATAHTSLVVYRTFCASFICPTIARAFASGVGKRSSYDFTTGTNCPTSLQEAMHCSWLPRANCSNYVAFTYGSSHTGSFSWRCT